jgi:hypothetical protein
MNYQIEGVGDIWAIRQSQARHCAKQIFRGRPERLAIFQTVTISPEQEKIGILFAANVEQGIPNDSASHDVPTGQTGTGKATSDSLKIAGLQHSLSTKDATTVSRLVVRRIGLGKQNLSLESLPDCDRVVERSLSGRRGVIGHHDPL